MIDTSRRRNKHTSKKVCTSLNSGLSVFFFTSVLCFDFLFSSGFRYLEEQRGRSTHHSWTLSSRLVSVETLTWEIIWNLHVEAAVILFCPPEGAVVLPYIQPHCCMSPHTRVHMFTCSRSTCAFCSCSWNPEAAVSHFSSCRINDTYLV